MEDYNAMVKTIHGLMRFARLQDQLVHPGLVSGLDERMKASIQWVIVANPRALENFAVDTEHGIWTLTSDAMQEWLLDMFTKAHRPRNHLVIDAAGADGVIDDLGRVEEKVERVMPVCMAECGITHLKSNNQCIAPLIP